LKYWFPWAAGCFSEGGGFASDAGPMYSPQVFKELMTPRLKTISDKCEELGVFHFFGSDGNIWPVADYMYLDGGVHGHYELDRNAGMDTIKLNEKYPHLTMAGNIASKTLDVGTPENVTAETKACLEKAKQTNKVIAGCSNIIISETTEENVNALLNAIAEFR